MRVRKVPLARRSISVGILALLLAGCTHAAIAQLKTLADTDWTDWVGPGSGPQLRARLKDKDQNAAQRIAAVEVEVRNAFLDNPDLVPQTGVALGVLQYQIDQCPAIVTTDSELQFQQLSPGNHLISVALIGRDSRLLTPKANLQVTIP
jgi:hypothetical protein